MTNYFQNAVAIRRELHQKPEQGWGEFCTTARIAQELESLGWKIFLGTQQVGLDCVMGRPEAFVNENLKRARMEGVDEAFLERMQGYTGCIALWETGIAGPVTAFRFDIDCVGVTETDDPQHKPNAENFASCYAGSMHACGHDGHTAIGLTVARWVADHAQDLKGSIKLIFQPAEEGVRGAAAQAASGLLDDVNYILGSHLSLCCRSGEICTNPQNVLATTKLDVTFTGKPAHPTMSPELGRDALACLCSTVSQIKAMAPHSKGMSCVNVGHIEAGEFRNVVPAHGLLQMEVRGATTEINNYMVEQATRIIKGNAQSYDVQCQITKAGEASSLANDEELLGLVTKVAQSIPECKEVVREKQFGASEDYTMLASRVQAHGGLSEFFIVGADRAGAHHQKNFDFDENALDLAIKIFVGCLNQLNNKTK